MVCERKIYPEFHDFTKPEWEPLDYWQHLDWLYQMDMVNYTSAPHQDKPSFESWRQDFEQAVKSGQRTPSLGQARLPFGKDKTRLYIAYEPGTNDPNIPNGSVLCQKNGVIQKYSVLDGGLYRVFILDETGKNLAIVERRVPVRTGDSFIEMMGAIEGCCGSSRTRTDILLFKGEVYLTSALLDGHDKKKNLEYIGILLGKPIFDNPLAVPREQDFPDSRYVEPRCNF
jgi:hypothetical protein